MAENVKTRSPIIREQARGELANAVAGFKGEVEVIKPKHNGVAPLPAPIKPRVKAIPAQARNPNTLLMADVLRVVQSRDNLSISLGMAIDWQTAVPPKHTGEVRDLMRFWPLLQKIKGNFQNGRTVLHFAEKYGYSPAYIQGLSDRFNVQKDAEVAHVLP
ncbi:MAG TPA: hypothetical protein VF672_22130 [Pseudomonas sp.]|jgi:hypothetical protein